MKNILIACSLLAASLLAAQPEVEREVYQYKGSIAGVVCSACSSVVKTSLMKLDEVIQVKISAGSEGELPTLTISATDPSLTASDLRVALGKAAAYYRIVDLRRIDDPIR
jgi:uncharacterized protein YsxB (DUF464 family)